MATLVQNSISGFNDPQPTYHISRYVRTRPPETRTRSLLTYSASTLNENQDIPKLEKGAGTEAEVTRNCPPVSQPLGSQPLIFARDGPDLDQDLSDLLTVIQNYLNDHPRLKEFLSKECQPVNRLAGINVGPLSSIRLSKHCGGDVVELKVILPQTDITPDPQPKIKPLFIGSRYQGLKDLYQLKAQFYHRKKCYRQIKEHSLIIKRFLRLQFGGFMIEETQIIPPSITSSKVNKYSHQKYYRKRSSKIEDAFHLTKYQVRDSQGHLVIMPFYFKGYNPSSFHRRILKFLNYNYVTQTSKPRVKVNNVYLQDILSLPLGSWVEMNIKVIQPSEEARNHPTLQWRSPYDFQRVELIDYHQIPSEKWNEFHPEDKSDQYLDNHLSRYHFKPRFNFINPERPIEWLFQDLDLFLFRYQFQKYKSKLNHETFGQKRRKFSIYQGKYFSRNGQEITDRLTQVSDLKISDPELFADYLKLFGHYIRVDQIAPILKKTIEATEKEKIRFLVLFFLSYYSQLTNGKEEYDLDSYSDFGTRLKILSHYFRHQDKVDQIYLRKYRNQIFGLIHKIAVKEKNAKEPAWIQYGKEGSEKIELKSWFQSHDKEPFFLISTFLKFRFPNCVSIAQIDDPFELMDHINRFVSRVRLLRMRIKRKYKEEMEKRIIREREEREKEDREKRIKCNQLYNKVINEGAERIVINENEIQYVRTIPLKMMGIWAKLTKMVSSLGVEEEKPAQLSLTYHSEKEGEPIKKIEVSPENQMIVYKKDRKIKDIYGYKLAKTCLGQNCIVKLYIPPNARVAISDHDNKLRTNRTTPIAIAPYKVRNGKVVFVGSGEFVPEAYSCVHCTGFKYQVGVEIFEPKFDPDPTDVCVPGIHFYAGSLEEVFQANWGRDYASELKNYQDLVGLTLTGTSQNPDPDSDLLDIDSGSKNQLPKISKQEVDQEILSMVEDHVSEWNIDLNFDFDPMQELIPPPLLQPSLSSLIPEVEETKEERKKIKNQRDPEIETKPKDSDTKSKVEIQQNPDEIFKKEVDPFKEENQGIDPFKWE